MDQKRKSERKGTIEPSPAINGGVTTCNAVLIVSRPASAFYLAITGGAGLSPVFYYLCVAHPLLPCSGHLLARGQQNRSGSIRPLRRRKKSTSECAFGNKPVRHWKRLAGARFVRRIT